MPEVLRPVVWHGDTLERVRDFPADARQDIGYELSRVQKGLEPRDWKAISAAGSGVLELRIHGENEYRVLCVTKWKDAVHVLHAFVKKTQRTRRADINIAAARYRHLVEEERRK